MVQLNVSITPEIEEMLEVVCDATGESKSGLAREYIQRGVYDDLEGLNRLEVYQRRMEEKGLGDEERKSEK